MLGIIVQLLLSLIIVWIYEKNTLRVLGLFPTKSRIIDLILFSLITATCCASGFFLKMYFSDIRWTLNPNLTLNLIFEGIWWNIKSVLYEELIFRGVIFYILIRKIGMLKAIFISATAFGIYHWFSYEVFGNPAQMVVIFLLTGIMGLVYAYGYAKTMSLYIPCAIHFGWNFTQNFVFSEGSIGQGIFIQSGNESFRTDSYLIFFIVFLTPLLSVLLINFYLIKRKNQVNPDIYTVKVNKTPITLSDENIIDHFHNRN